MKNLIIAGKLFFLMTLITGVIYPASITLYCYFFVKEKSIGSFIEKNGTKIGSELIAQKFNDPKYFWNRPSSIDYNPLLSGASNLSLTSLELKNQVDIRKQQLLKVNEFEVNNNEVLIPQDLLFASGSGLDPHISPKAAIFQATRVAKIRNINISTVYKIINDLTESPQYGIFGDQRINTLKLNFALDNLKK